MPKGEELIREDENGIQTVVVNNRQDINKLMAASGVTADNIKTPGDFITPWLEQHFNQYEDISEFKNNILPQSNIEFTQIVQNGPDLSTQEQVTEEVATQEVEIVNTSEVTSAIDRSKTQNELLAQLVDIIDSTPVVLNDNIDSINVIINSDHFNANNRGGKNFDILIPFGFNTIEDFNQAGPEEWLNYLDSLDVYLKLDGDTQ